MDDRSSIIGQLVLELHLGIAGDGEEHEVGVWTVTARDVAPSTDPAPTNG